MATDPLTQLKTHLEGRYEVEREIGAGGMATVYLARDLRHDRHVALKLLNPELGAVLGVERFLSEIRVTANLQHPNLLPLFDSGEAGGLLYYVMPYVEGESLRHRLDREQQLPVDETVHIATAVANALDYAHAHDVIHRDLKPENILLQHGEPLVADFGIALAVSRAGGSRVTQTGLSLGTPMYMSPEQATGDRVIDGRSDIYSLGAVVYEMLAGEPPHAGNSAQAIIAKLMTEEPRPLSTLRPATPPSVAAAVHRALQKLPADRWKTAHEFAEALRAPITDPAMAFGVAAPRSGARRWWPVAVAGVAGLALGAAAMTHRAPETDTTATLRFHLVVPDSQRYVGGSGIPFAISPDNRLIAYAGAGGTASDARIYVHDLEDMQTRPLPGSDGVVRQPTFSPDGKWVVFNLDDRIVKTPVDGGPLRTLLQLDHRGNAGLSWVDPDTIVASVGDALIALPADGSTPVALSRPDSARGEILQWGPRVVSRRFVAYVSVSFKGVSDPHLAMLDRKTGTTTITTQPCTVVLGMVDDRLACVTPMGAVTVARVDGDGHVGPARPVIEGVLVRPGGAAKAALSPGGSLIYVRGTSRDRLVLVDLHGNVTPIPGDARAYSHPSVSPDGRQIAVSILDAGQSNVWLVDAATGAQRRLTSDGRADQPAWSADGKRVVYRDRGPNGATINFVAADGSGEGGVLVDSAADPDGPRMSPDGKTLLLTAIEAATPRKAARRIAEVPASGGHVPIFVEAPLDQFVPSFSPDGKWIAYWGAGAGVADIFVRRSSGAGPSSQVTTDGGTEPLWAPDGRTIYYRVGRGVNAARLTFAPDPRVTSSAKLFTTNMRSDLAWGAWDITPDGKHFVMLQSVDQPGEVVIVWHWADELRKSLALH